MLFVLEVELKKALLLELVLLVRAQVKFKSLDLQDLLDLLLLLLVKNAMERESISILLVVNVME